VQLARDDCLDANSCTQSLSHPPWEFHALLTCHACRLPLGRDPCGSSLSQWLSIGGAYYRVPTPHARVPRDLGLSLLVTGVWLENHLSLSIFIVEVPRPEASMPCLGVAPSTTALTREPKETPSCPAVLSRGLSFEVPSCGLWSTPETGQRPRLVNARGWSTLEDWTIQVLFLSDNIQLEKISLKK